MGKLQNILLDKKNIQTVVDDCVQLVEKEVTTRKGIAGILVKAGYKAFTAIKPKILEDSVARLLDDFIEVLDGYYNEYESSKAVIKTELGSWMTDRADTIANDLLAKTDSIIEASKKNTIKRIYFGLRKIAQRNVASSIPNVAALIDELLNKVDENK